MIEMTSEIADDICKAIALKASHLIEKEVRKAFHDSADWIPADVTVSIILAESALNAFKSVSGIEYAKVVRCKE